MGALSMQRRSLWEAQLSRFARRSNRDLHDELQLVYQASYGLPPSVRFCALVVCKRAGFLCAMDVTDEMRLMREAPGRRAQGLRS